MNPDEENLEKISIDEAIVTLMQDLPKPVQEFLLSDERGQVARELSAKYGLHVDQAGAFEEAYLHMLLGIAAPEDFVSSLRKAGVAQEAVNGLATDVNERVFMRLREKEREGATPAPQKPTPLPPPAIEYQPAPTLPGSPVPAPMPVPAPALEAVVAPVQQVVPVAPAPILEPTPPPQHIVPQQHFVHSMPSAQPQSGWHPAAAVHIFVPTHGMPYQQQAPEPSIPAYTPPVLQAPVAPAAPLPQAVPVPMPIVPPPVSVAPSIPLTKDYGSDPYREPIQ